MVVTVTYSHKWDEKFQILSTRQTDTRNATDFSERGAPLLFYLTPTLSCVSSFSATYHNSSTKRCSACPPPSTTVVVVTLHPSSSPTINSWFYSIGGGIGLFHEVL